MTLGEKLKTARLEAGLSQKALCGEQISRNMLSQIEHGTARPSMDTLRYLADRLGKPMGFFLDGETNSSPNLTCIQNARAAWQAGQWERTLDILKDFRPPDDFLEGEYRTLLALSLLAGAENGAKNGQTLYALALLQKLESISVPYFQDIVDSRRFLLLSEMDTSAEPSALLPSLDRVLLSKVRALLHRGDPVRAGNLLDGMDSHQSPRWSLLRGQVHCALAQYAQAIDHLLAAEDRFPEIAIPLLEQCFRELGDYRRAYDYACKQKRSSSK